MPHDTPLSAPYPAVARKKVTAAFDNGLLSSDSGAMLLYLADDSGEAAHRFRN